MEATSKASARFILREPVPIRRSALARFGSVLEGLFLGTAMGSVPLDLEVFDKLSGRVVYFVRVNNDVALRSAQQSIRRDLAELTIDDFRLEYGFGDP